MYVSRSLSPIIMSRQNGGRRCLIRLRGLEIHRRMRIHLRLLGRHLRRGLSRQFRQRLLVVVVLAGALVEEAAQCKAARFQVGIAAVEDLAGAVEAVALVGVEVAAVVGVLAGVVLRGPIHSPDLDLLFRGLSHLLVLDWDRTACCGCVEQVHCWMLWKLGKQVCRSEPSMLCTVAWNTF